MHMTQPAPSPAPTADGAAAAAVPQPAVAPLAPVLSAEKEAMLAQAQAERRKLVSAAVAAGRPEGVQLMGPKEWRKLISACVLRLKKVSRVWGVRSVAKLHSDCLVLAVCVKQCLHGEDEHDGW